MCVWTYKCHTGCWINNMWIQLLFKLQATCFMNWTILDIVYLWDYWSGYTCTFVYCIVYLAGCCLWNGNTFRSVKSCDMIACDNIRILMTSGFINLMHSQHTKARDRDTLVLAENSCTCQKTCHWVLFPFTEQYQYARKSCITSDQNKVLPTDFQNAWTVCIIGNSLHSLHNSTIYYWNVTWKQNFIFDTNEKTWKG